MLETHQEAGETLHPEHLELGTSVERKRHKPFHRVPADTPSVLLPLLTWECDLQESTREPCMGHRNAQTNDGAVSSRGDVNSPWSRHSEKEPSTMSTQTCLQE